MKKFTLLFSDIKALGKFMAKPLDGHFDEPVTCGGSYYVGITINDSPSYIRFVDNRVFNLGGVMMDKTN